MKDNTLRCVLAPTHIISPTNPVSFSSPPGNYGCTDFSIRMAMIRKPVGARNCRISLRYFTHISALGHLYLTVGMKIELNRRRNPGITRLLSLGWHQTEPRRFLSHHICLSLQSPIVINRYALHLQGWFHYSLLLLNYMPRFVRQMFFLSRRQIYVGTQCICQRLDLRRLGRVVVNLHIVHRNA